MQNILETMMPLEEEKLKRILRAKKLIEENNAGINIAGRIVDMRKHPDAEKLAITSDHAREIIFLSEIIS